MQEPLNKYVFKYIIVGNPSVGKSCILNQFVNKEFTEEYEITIGIDFLSHPIIL